MCISVVIPTFNSANEIRTCLESVERVLPDAEAVVVDNGSTDETIEAVRMAYPCAIILSGHGNVGFGRACNLGAERASNELILFLNPDAVLLEADQGHLTELGSNARVGLIGGTLVDADGSIVPARGGYGRSWILLFLTDHCLGLLLPRTLARALWRRTARQRNDAVSGAICLVSGKEFDALGGFDERFFMYYEDTDLARRYSRAGYPVHSSMLLVAHHVGGASARAHRLLALSFLALLEYTAKWYSPRTARAAGLVGRSFYSTLLRLLTAFARLTGGRRARAKVAQISAMLSVIATGGVPENMPGPAYPVATPLAREIFAGFRR